MSNARNLSDIVGGNFDIPSGSLDNLVAVAVSLRLNLLMILLPRLRLQTMQ